MAGLSWIFFGVCVVTCSAQFGYNLGDNPFNRPQSPRRPDPLLKALQISEDDHRCFTLARRPFYMTRPMQYPCYKRMNGVPVVQSFIGPFGPMCVSMFREPVHRYYKIEMCCPGYTTDTNGKCSIRTGARRQMPNPVQQQQQRGRNMMAMAAEMRNMMWLRAKTAMARKRAIMMNNMRRNMMMARRPPMPPMSPMSPMSPMFHKMMMRAMMRPRPPMFRRPRLPLPMPRPVQRPPINGRFIKLLRNTVSRPVIVTTSFRVPLSPPQFQQEEPREPTRMILSNMSPDERVDVQKLHPMDQPIPRPPQIAIPQEFHQQQQEEFTQTPDNGESMFLSDGYSPEGGFQTPDAPMGVDLPDQPVEMPKLIVEQSPLSDDQQTSCIMTLNTAVKSCLKQNNIDVPDVMSAFGPFNDEMSSVLCEREEGIFACISDALQGCNTTEEAQVARDMLLETADTVRAMCVHRQMIVTQPDSAMPEQMAAVVNEPTSANVADTMATVENVDDIPTDVQPAGTEQITVIEDRPPAPAPAPVSSHSDHDHAFQQAVRHEVHVKEVEMEEYYLPLLVGSGVGFVVVVLLAALCICCCCRRRLRKKMKMMKEVEKPPIQDEIYSISIAPPNYEVNGIPPMYYEEAKGEKISSRSPSVQQGQEAPDGDLGTGTQM